MKMFNKKGIFLTFMAFMLASAVIALTISQNQLASDQGENISSETAFKGANGRFNNIRQQIMVTKEGYAGSAYGRIMPFKKFTAGKNWFEIEQSIPADTHIEKGYDAINLFAIFAEEKGSDGLEVDISHVSQSNYWDNSSEPIEYIVMPQCYKFGIAQGADMTQFTKGEADNDGCEFEENSISNYDVAIHLEDWVNVNGITCGEEFSACADSGNPSLERYSRIEFILDDCPDPCFATGFDSSGRAVISANLPQNPNSDTLVRVEYNNAADFEVSFEGFVPTVSDNTKGKLMKSRIEFNDPIEEIVLAPGSFEFSVKKPNFNICRATNETGCT